MKSIFKITIHSFILSFVIFETVVNQFFPGFNHRAKNDFLNNRLVLKKLKRDVSLERVLIKSNAS